MKTALIVLGVIIFAGGIGFVVMNNQDEPEATSSSTAETVQQEEPESESQTQTTFEDNPDPNNYTDGANIGETVDATNRNEVTITADEYLFNPTFLKIKKGTKVTWVNNGNIGHDITSANTSPNGGLASSLLNNGDTYEFTFNEAGLYEYFCTPHPIQMRGVITVVE